MAIEAARGDLMAFLLLAGTLAGAAYARYQRRDDDLLARVGRSALWLLAWHGAGLTLRLTGGA